MLDPALLAQTAETTAAAYKSASGIIDDLLGRIDAIKTRKLSLNNLLRAYYFEVVANIEFLNVVNLDACKGLKPNAALLKSVMDRIDIQLGAAILFEENVDKGSELYKLLEDKGKLDNRRKNLYRISGGTEVRVTTASFYENILQAISFTVIKTQLLKRLSCLEDAELAMLKPVQCERRLANIMERFKMIKSKLEELKAIASAAR